MNEPIKPILKKCAAKEIQKVYVEDFFFEINQKELQKDRKEFLEENPGSSEEEFMEYVRDCCMMPINKAKKNLSLQDLIEYVPKGIPLDELIFSFNGKDFLDYCDDLFSFERTIKRTPAEIKEVNEKNVVKFKEDLEKYKSAMKVYKEHVEIDAIQYKKEQLKNIHESAKKLSREIEQMERDVNHVK